MDNLIDRQMNGLMDGQIGRQLDDHSTFNLILS